MSDVTIHLVGRRGAAGEDARNNGMIHKVFIENFDAKKLSYQIS